MTKCSQKNRQTTDNNVVKICQEQHRQNHLVYKALKRGHNFVRHKVIFHLSWCASLAIMLYVIRHAVNAKSVENYFLTR